MKRRFFAPLALLAALACRNQPLAPSSAAGLTLALTLTRTSLQRGESDTITITLTNTNPDTVFLGVGGCPLVFFVTDARGATVVPAGGNWFCIDILTRLTLSPGEREAVPFIWDTRSSLPGIYSVYGTFSAETVHLQTPQAAVQLN